MYRHGRVGVVFLNKQKIMRHALEITSYLGNHKVVIHFFSFIHSAPTMGKAHVLSARTTKVYETGPVLIHRYR